MSKLSELKSQIVYLSISVFSFISAFALPYLQGRANSIWTFPWLFPTDFMPLFLLFISSAMLFSKMIGSFHTKRNISATALIFLGGTLLFVAWFFVFAKNQYFYQLGLSTYAKRILGTEQWRDISRFAQENIKPGDYLWGPKKSHQSDDEQKLWSEFANHTEIEKLGPYTMVYVRDKYTQIMWGGALVGHRGVAIYSSTNDIDISQPPYASSKLIFIAPDIATFISD